MMRPGFKAILLGLTVLSTAARADSLKSETTAGYGSFTEAFSYDGSSKNPGGGKPEDGIWDWNLGLNYNSAPGTNPKTGNPELAKTYEFKGGAGYEPNKVWDFGADLLYSTTPLELMQSVGPDLYVGYTYTFEKPSTQDEEAPFSPSMGLRVTGGVLKYSLSSIAAGNGVPPGRAKANAPEITQRSVGLDFNASPFEFMSVKLSYTKYGYDKDPGDFSSALGSARSIVVQRITAGLANASSGFPSFSEELSFSAYPTQDWEIEPALVLTKTKADGSVSHAYELTVTHDLTELWAAGVGGERDVSPSVREWLGVLSVTRHL